MTLSESVDERLLARKQADHPRSGTPATSANTAGRPRLRVIDGQTQAASEPPHTPNDHAASTHWGAATTALGRHTATSTHPPTVAEAAADIWPDPGQVRHGLAGQLASAAAGLAQLVGLGLCWGAAHTLFATKTRAAITAVILLFVLLTAAIASHT